jgi:hypothetical protein
MSFGRSFARVSDFADGQMGFGHSPVCHRGTATHLVTRLSLQDTFEQLERQLCLIPSPRTLSKHSRKLPILLKIYLIYLRLIGRSG